MNGGQEADAFDEKKARDLVYDLLKNDIKSFKNLIPEIRNMDSNSFKNLFHGIPFKGKNHEDDGYDYQVQSRKQFEKLIEKFDNFWVVLDNWYLDGKYYKYLKELWINYICIENLRKKDEISRELILSSNSIDYKNWPKDIKDDFSKVIQVTTNTIIIKKKPKYEKIQSQIQTLMDQLNIFKNSASKEPDLREYTINNEKIIDKIEAYIKKYGKKFFGFLQNSKMSKNLGLLSIIPFVSATYFNLQDNKSENYLSNYKNYNYITDFEYDDEDCNEYSDYDDEDDYDNENNGENSDNFNLEENSKKILENGAFCTIYVAASFLCLGWSVYGFCKTYKDLKKIEEDLEKYEKSLKKIEKNFKDHKIQIGILPDDPEEAIEIIKGIYNKICKDYNDLEDLIKEIYKSLAEAKNLKEESKLRLACSGILGAIGIVGSVVIPNTYSFWYGVSSISNAVSTIANSASYISSSKKIDELNTILERAKQLRKEILDKMENHLKEASGQTPKFNYF